MKMSDMGTTGLVKKVLETPIGRKRALVLQTARRILRARGHGEQALIRFNKNVK